MQIFKVHNHMIENRVREFREKLEMTQTELAEAISVSRQTIHSIESKKVIPTIEIAIKIGKVLKIKLEKLFFQSKKEMH
mgnify:CR=1 FL=1